MASKEWQKKVEDEAIPSWKEVGALVEMTAKMKVADSPGEEEKEVELEFVSLVMRRNFMDLQKKWAEAELKKANDELLVVMASADRDKVKLWDGMKLEKRAGNSPAKIEPTMLLSHGVTLDQINAATVPGKPYHYVMVTREKGGK